MHASLQWDFYHSSAVSSFVNQQNQQQQQPPPNPHALSVLYANCSFLNLPKVHKSQQYKLVKLGENKIKAIIILYLVGFSPSCKTENCY